MSREPLWIRSGFRSFRSWYGDLRIPISIHYARVLAYLKAFIPGPRESRLHRLSSHKSVYVSPHEKSSTYHIFQSKNLDSMYPREEIRRPSNL